MSLAKQIRAQQDQIERLTEMLLKERLLLAEYRKTITETTAQLKQISAQYKKDPRQ